MTGLRTITMWRVMDEAGKVLAKSGCLRAWLG